MCKRLIWIIVFAFAGFITALITVAIALFAMGSVSGLFADIFDLDRGAFLQVVACLMSVAVFYCIEGLFYKTP
jgi:VIT1/CCC1 family predicted Fe2+/Mn2+ transporter